MTGLSNALKYTFNVDAQQGVQGDAVLLPGSGVPPAHLPPFSFAAAGGMSRVLE